MAQHLHVQHEGDDAMLGRAPSLDALDGLRGIGAVCIVMYHFFSGFTPQASELTQYPVYAPELMSVVTLFFVISGFTLTCVYDAGTKPPPMFAFLKKRVARLVPIYYTSLLPALPSFYVYTATPALTATTTLLMIQSLVVPNEGWNMPLWQVSAFAFTYPFFPLALARLRKWSTRALRISLVAFMVVNVLVVVVAGQFILPLLHLNIGILHRWAPFRLPQFYTGIAAGILAQRGKLSGATVWAEGVFLTLATSALIVCPAVVYIMPMFPALSSPTWDFYCLLAEYSVTPLHAVLLMALCSPDCTGFFKYLLLSPPLKFLGQISYSIYCLHAPTMFLAAWAVKNKGVNRAGLPLMTEPNTGIVGYFCFPPWAIVPLLAVIVVVAAAAHFAIEKPSRKLLTALFRDTQDSKPAAPVVEVPKNGVAK